MTTHGSRLAAALAVTTLACEGGSASSGSSSGGSAGCEPGERIVDDRCVAPGVQDDGCPAGELGVEGVCRPAGVPAELCGEGFVPDDSGGCMASLPEEPCEPGFMAIPGEAACREVAPCAPGRWGAIPIEPNTQHVDATFMGASDGSAQSPWKTIQDAVDAAAPAAIVAVAAGSYQEDVTIANEPVRLWGVCPSQVEIVGSTGPSSLAAVFALELGSGSEIRDLAIRGGSVGLLVSSVAELLVSRVWFHDTADTGVSVEDALGPAAIVVQDSLIESATRFGILAIGTDVSFDASVVRSTQPRASDQAFGRGLVGVERAHMTVSGSVVERNRDSGVHVDASTLVMEATLVRDTGPQLLDSSFGRGVTIVTDLMTGERATATVRACVIERSHDAGVFVRGSDATIEACVVRDTAPQELDSQFGRGIGVQDKPGPANVTLLSSVVERSYDVGVFIGGSEATIAGVIVRDTEAQLSDLMGGHGIHVQLNPDNQLSAKATVRGSILERNVEFGVLGTTAQVDLQGIVVRGTRTAADGSFGDGVTAWSLLGPAPLSLVGSRIEQSPRAAVASFGAPVHLRGNLIDCNAIDIDGELWESSSYTFEDAGGNLCGCGGTVAACKVVSTNLTPPPPP